MARTKGTSLARERYEDVETAVRELGTLWVLDAINRNLTYNRKRMREMRVKRVTEAVKRVAEADIVVRKGDSNE